VIDIISLAIRIAMLECSNLEIKGPIILDEPAKHVSDKTGNTYVPKAGNNGNAQQASQ